MLRVSGRIEAKPNGCELTADVEQGQKRGARQTQGAPRSGNGAAERGSGPGAERKAPIPGPAGGLLRREPGQLHSARCDSRIPGRNRARARNAYDCEFTAANGHRQSVRLRRRSIGPPWRKVKGHRAGRGGRRLRPRRCASFVDVIIPDAACIGVVQG